MTAFIVNPKPYVDEEAVLREIRRWLTEEAIRGAPDENDVFQAKWNALHFDDRSILAALIAEGGRDIKEQSVRRRLINSHGFGRDRASEILQTRMSVLSRENLVRLHHNAYDGDEMSLHPHWGVVCAPGHWGWPRLARAANNSRIEATPPRLALSATWE